MEEEEERCQHLQADKKKMQQNIQVGPSTRVMGQELWDGADSLGADLPAWPL